ncbi:MAG: Glycosyltransferase WecB/TagA/CpsF family protein [Candidatus Magasanikbacteria bacterium GW2011_GWC2_37_14]|uniref:Glycosyltransferase WecB/TagA/CpsF family protein n=1 Tax=Candidatus Magasanikbacteria bacterium GW2011_GWC2_37_14 TaxID=1619046 RepID=A0A0G0IST7_9BACT|nr:MAG: Glycosyltransferase WecB/TagA/CpsF family protein [Candidatus Magasanikbacteria bacterium GW2011_GWC2_37_14]
MPKIKVLHIIPVFATGGAERLVWQYAKFLPKAVFEIAVASCVEDGEFRVEFEKLGVKVFVGSRQTMGSRQKVYGELNKFVAEFQPQIVHTHMLSADFFGWLLKRKYQNKITWISTMHNVETATSYLRQLLWRYILKRADQVISVCQKVENFTLKEFKIKSKKSLVILNGIDLEPWLKIPANSLFKNPVLQIACVGRFWEQKGQQYLLESLALLKIPWQLHLYGEGPLKNKLQQQAESLKINQQIVWHGVSTNLALELAKIDLIVQPSLWEGLSLVVMEGMTASRLVIATEPAAEELVKDNFTGLVVPAKDVEKLTQTIIWVAEHPEEANKLAEAGRLYAQKHFGLEKNLEKLIKLYENEER